MHQNSYQLILYLYYSDKDNKITLTINSIDNIIKDINNNTNIYSNYHLIIKDNNNNEIFERKVGNTSSDRLGIILTYITDPYIELNDKINKENAIEYFSNPKNTEAFLYLSKYATPLYFELTPQEEKRIDLMEKERKRKLNNIIEVYKNIDVDEFQYGITTNECQKTIKKLKINKSAFSLLSKGFSLLTVAFGVAIIKDPSVIAISGMLSSFYFAKSTKINRNINDGLILITDHKLTKIKQKEKENS